MADFLNSAEGNIGCVFDIFDVIVRKCHCKKILNFTRVIEEGV